MTDQLTPRVVLVGPMGAGKSTVGALLADRWGLALRDTDAVVEAREGRSISDIFVDSGEAHFRALEREAPVLALVEAAGSGYPQGYAPTGEVLRGEASWYGPGFVGNPTASGAPYDPERLTCAHKTLPLGTVIRVSRRGLAVSCLVNDRGPYVGARILDMSRAGSRALGYDGVATVTVEVLAYTG